MADIRVGYHTITWGMDGFELALDEIAALGFKGFETFAAVVDTYGNKVSEFQDLIGQRGLELVTVYGGGPMNEAHRMDEMIARNVGFAKFLAAHGADRLVLGGGSRAPGGPSSDDLHNQAHCMNEIGRRCLDFGVLACYHPHYATTVETDEEIEIMMHYTDPRYVFLCPDTAHVRKGGGNELAVVRTYADRVKYVHLKDWDPQAFLRRPNRTSAGRGCGNSDLARLRGTWRRRGAGERMRSGAAGERLRRVAHDRVGPLPLHAQSQRGNE